jgi:hypothetical protein
MFGVRGIKRWGGMKSAGPAAHELALRPHLAGNHAYLPHDLYVFLADSTKRSAVGIKLTVSYFPAPSILLFCRSVFSSSMLQYWHHAC